MGVERPKGSSVVERVVEWAKDVGGKIKEAVAKGTGTSGYAAVEESRPLPEWSGKYNLGRFAAKHPPVGTYFELVRTNRILDDASIEKLLRQALEDFRALEKIQELQTPKTFEQLQDTLRELKARTEKEMLRDLNQIKM